MPLAPNRFEHEWAMHQDSMEIDCSGDKTPVEWQSWILLLESEVALGGIQGETCWKGGKVVVDVPVNG